MSPTNFQITVEARVSDGTDYTADTIAKNVVTRTVAAVDLADVASQTELDYEVTTAFEAVRSRLTEELAAQIRLAERQAEVANVDE